MEVATPPVRHTRQEILFSFGIEMFIYARETGYSPDYGLIIGTLVHSACSFDGVARPAIGQSYLRSTTCGSFERIKLAVHTVESG
jgi:hypothetical protein